MMSPEEVEAAKRRNNRSIRELIWSAYSVGMDLMKPTRWTNLIRFINIVLVLSSTISLYGHWTLFLRNIHEIPKFVESICTALQTIMSIIKLVYYLFVQRRFYILLKIARCHELVQQCEIFHSDLPIQAKLKPNIEAITAVYWRSTRRQLIFYLCSCIAICSNYLINSHLVNLYHYFKGSPNYIPILPFPSFSVFPSWECKGMTLPYYPIQMFISSCAVYISGICAVSFDSLFVVLCLHGVAMMKSLTLMLRSSTSDLIPQERRVEYLRYCIYQYKRIYAYYLEVRNIFRHIILTQFILSLLVWGLVLYLIGLGFESNQSMLLRMILYLAAAGYQIVIYCYNGQLFTNASEEIPEALYNCIWYEESNEFKQLMRMMIMRTHRYLVLDVSWFTRMSLTTLVAMIRSSGSYFLLLRNVTKQNNF